MFISNAYAAAGPAAGDGSLSYLAFWLVLALVFYYALWRPQSKRAKEQRDLVANLQKNDEVVTNGGILGKITKVSDDFLTLAIAAEVEIKVQKNAVTTVLPKGTIKSL